MYHCLVAKNVNYKKCNHVQESEKKMILEPLSTHMT